MEEFVLVFSVAAIVAIVLNFGQSKFAASTNSTLVSLQSNYFGKTFLTAMVIFGAILTAGLLLKVATGRTSIPTAV